MPLHSFTWHVSIPQDSTVELASPGGSLRQALPGQGCNRSLSFRVEESNGLPLGDFCFDGAIQKIQAHTNISVTATGANFQRSRGPVLNLTFSQEISGKIVQEPVGLIRLATQQNRTEIQFRMLSLKS